MIINNSTQPKRSGRGRARTSSHDASRTAATQLHFLGLVLSLGKAQSSICTRGNLIKTTKRSVLMQRTAWFSPQLIEVTGESFESGFCPPAV